MEEEIENLIVDWLKSDSENVTVVAHEITSLIKKYINEQKT